jgi:hypothetical protein
LAGRLEEAGETLKKSGAQGGQEFIVDHMQSHGGGRIATEAVSRLVGQIPVLRGTQIAAVPGSEIMLGGKLRFATEMERYVAVRLKDLPAFSKVLGRAEKALDYKLLLDGGTYLAAEIGCVAPAFTN